MVTDTLVS